MSLFKKKKRIDTVVYWKSKVDYLFSNEFDKVFQLLIKTKSDILSSTSKTELKEHIIAAYIELLGITFAKNNVNRDKRYEIESLMEDYLNSKNGNSIIRLIHD